MMNFVNYDTTKWALGHLPSLPNAASRLVLVNLAARWNDAEGCARPGVDRIAADVGVTPRTVQRALRNLEQIGILRTQPSYNKPSIYLLNFDFLVAGAGDKKSPQNKKVDLGVTKSQARGDFLSPPEVTKSHPNKTVNKLFKTQQQVVFENLIWEKPLEANQKTACEILLSAAELPPEICQKFGDEMAGQGRREPIRNPAGWLKNMLGRYGRPGFTFAYADQVSAARAGRLAQAERESLALLALPPPPKADPLRRPEREAKILSSVGRASLAASRAVLASPPLGKHQPTSSPGATSAHTVATSTPAAATP